MTKNNNDNKNENTLYAWATGNLASIAIGLAVGTFIYKSGILPKVLGRFFGTTKGKSVSAGETSKSV